MPLPRNKIPEKRTFGAKAPNENKSPHPDDIVATDSEWDISLKEPWLSTAFATSSGTVVCLRDDLPQRIQSRLGAAACELGVKLLFGRRKDSTNLLEWSLPYLGVPEGLSVRLAFFFSPKDIEYALGWDRVRSAIHSGKVHQRNNLNGRIDGTRLKDLSGWADKGSLKKLATALGVAMPEKTSMDKYKSRMLLGLEKRPEDFLRYAVGDVKALLDIYARFVAFVRRIQKEVLDMTDLWNANDIPMTCGRLVADTFQRWLEGRAWKRACRCPPLLLPLARIPRPRRRGLFTQPREPRRPSQPLPHFRSHSPHAVATEPGGQ